MSLVTFFIFLSAAAVSAVEWGPCTNYQPSPPVWIHAECARFPAPLDWHAPHTNATTHHRTLSLHVTRIALKADVGRPKAYDFWFLQGGPGLPGPTIWGEDFLSAYDKLGYSSKLSDVTLWLYLPDHRGVGQSEALSCMPLETPEDAKACFPRFEQKWGREWFEYFTTEAAGKDVALLVDETARAEREKTFVYGVSYGTVRF